METMLIPLGWVVFFVFIVWPIKALFRRFLPDGKLKDALFKER